nr:MAG TPA: hypothetical protein [Caudoviricetes sp.]
MRESKGRWTKDKLIRTIKAVNIQGFDFTCNIYNYRHARLRKLIREMNKAGLVKVKRNIDQFIVRLTDGRFNRPTK